MAHNSTFIKQSNILVDEANRPQLADFGLAALADTQESKTTDCAGSLRWMAPELHDPEKFGLKRLARSYEADVYAFGCLCLEVRASCTLICRGLTSCF